MQQIAQKAGVSYGLFYHYFRSKEDILGAAVEQMSILPKIKDHLARHDEPLEPHLQKLITLYLELLDERREVVWLVFSESRKFPVLAEKLHRLGEDSRSALVEYLKARSAVGEICKDCDLEEAARIIWGQLFVRHLWVELDGDPCRFLPVFLEGLRPKE